MYSVQYDVYSPPIISYVYHFLFKLGSNDFNEQVNLYYFQTPAKISQCTQQIRHFKSTKLYLPFIILSFAGFEENSCMCQAVLVSYILFATVFNKFDCLKWSIVVDFINKTICSYILSRILDFSLFLILVKVINVVVVLQKLNLINRLNSHTILILKLFCQ